MHITRRNFIQTISAAAAFFSTQGLDVFGQKKGRNVGFAVPAEAYSEALFSMTAKQFEPMIGQIATVTDAEGRAFELILTEVNRIERLHNTVQGYYGECFSLIFDGDRAESFSQSIYEIRIESVEFSALVVPVGLNRKRYEVIVNHLSR